MIRSDASALPPYRIGRCPVSRLIVALNAHAQSMTCCREAVRFDALGARTQSLVMRSRSGTVRFIDARHRVRKLQEFSAIDYT